MGKIAAVFKDGTKWKTLFLSILMMSIGYGLHKGIIDNYLAEIVGMGEMDRGVTEFFRELPGFMLIFILALFYKFSAEKMYKLGGIIMVAGMGLLAIVPPYKALVIFSIFLYSTGEHIQLGMKNTLSLEYSKAGQGGQALGYQNAIYQIGNLVGYFVVIILFWFVSAKAIYQPFFFAATTLMILSLMLALRLSGKSETDKTKSRFYFRKKFTKYYMLEIFYGARKQVFFTFGPYVLILFYGANASVISLLFAVSAISCFILSPVVGKLVDKIGYKPVMVGDTLILVIVCFFYGFAHHLFPKNVAFIICCINYVLDSVISLASMASNVYVQDISDSKEEMRATISTGISVNHMITIFIALFGGWIWQKLGIETLFIVSAVLGLCNSAYAATIKVKKKAFNLEKK
ncbi:MAG: MFS transporter [Treponema sp.]|nr:MFS transporter [Treponema sp.]